MLFGLRKRIVQHRLKISLDDAPIDDNQASYYVRFAALSTYPIY